VEVAGAAAGGGRGVLFGGSMPRRAGGSYSSLPAHLLTCLPAGYRRLGGCQGR